MNKVLRVATAVIATFAAGLVGMLFVNNGVGAWYAGLHRPPFMPPEAFFPIAWTILYLLAAIACSLVWLKEPQDAHTESWVRFYFVHLLPNVGWTIFFFGFHSITVSFIDALVLAFFVIALAASAWEIDRRVTYFLLPYALWVLFAAYLTAGIWLLN